MGGPDRTADKEVKMGVSIHYRGRLDNTAKLPEFREKIAEHRFSLQMAISSAGRGLERPRECGPGPRLERRGF